MSLNFDRYLLKVGTHEKSYRTFVGTAVYVSVPGLIDPRVKSQTVTDTFNDYHPRIQFTHEMERNNSIRFLHLEIIKLYNGKIVSNLYRKITYSGRVLNFISNHPFQNKVAII